MNFPISGLNYGRSADERRSFRRTRRLRQNGHTAGTGRQARGDTATSATRVALWRASASSPFGAPPQSASPFGAPPPQAAPPPQRASAFDNVAPPPVTGGAETIQFGLNPLVQAAAPLLQLLGRLRNTVSNPNVDDLRERTVRQVRQFEQAARDGGVPNEQLRPAHYALCASIDDVVLNTPWGSQGGWAARSLVSTFHQETRSGERFFRILEDLGKTPATYLPVLELMYLLPEPRFPGPVPPAATPAR